MGYRIKILDLTQADLLIRFPQYYHILSAPPAPRPTPVSKSFICPQIQSVLSAPRTPVPEARCPSVSLNIGGCVYMDDADFVEIDIHDEEEGKSSKSAFSSFFSGVVRFFWGFFTEHKMNI